MCVLLCSCLFNSTVLSPLYVIIWIFLSLCFWSLHSWLFNNANSRNTSLSEVALTSHNDTNAIHIPVLCICVSYMKINLLWLEAENVALALSLLGLEKRFVLGHMRHLDCKQWATAWHDIHKLHSVSHI